MTCTGTYGNGVRIGMTLDTLRQSPTDDPTGPVTGDRRVSRGGGWEFMAELCRCAVRENNGPGAQGFELGFRVSLDPAEH